MVLAVVFFPKVSCRFAPWHFSGLVETRFPSRPAKPAALSLTTTFFSRVHSTYFGSAFSYRRLFNILRPLLS